MTKLKPFTAILIIFVVFVSILGYYYTHKPFNAENGVGLFKAIWQILIAFAILVLAGGLGKRIRGNRTDPIGAVDLVLECALGLGLLSIFLVTFGLTIGVNVIPVLILMVLLVAFTAKDTLAWLHGWKNFQFAASNSTQRIWLIFIAVILFCGLVTALAPPLHYDAITYHLSLPQIYLQSGRIVYVPDIMYGGMPQATEMLFLLAIRFGGIEAATVLGWTIGLLTLLGLFAFAREQFSPAAGWMSVAALLAGTTFAESLAWGYNDWSAMLYGLACLIALDKWTSTRTMRDLLLAAAFAGMALATKYTGGIVMLCGLAAILFHVRRERLTRIIRDLLLFAGISSLMLLPWMLKNTMQTGNPFYPLLFPAGAMDATRVAFYQGGAIDGTWLDLLILPWQATVFGVEGGVGFSASIGPLLLGFGLVSLLQFRALTEEQKRILQSILVVLSVTWLIWAFGSRISALLIQTRLFFPVFPAWAILAGAGYHTIEKEKLSTVRLGMIVGILTSIVFAFTTLEVVRNFSVRDPASVIFGATNQEKYMERNLGSFAPAMQAVRNLPADAHVLLLWEARNLYCLPKCEPDEIIDRWYHDRNMYSDAASILTEWQDEGYTHLLYFKLGSDNRRVESKRFTAEDWNEMDLLLSQLSVVEDYNHVYILYSLEGQ